jgi:hypothetical protein
VANHTAGVDPVLIQAVAPFEIRFLMARDMQPRVLRELWEWTGVIAVNRDGPDSRAAREAIRWLREGGLDGTGGVIGTFTGGTMTGAVIRPQTQRGQHLDVLAPAEKVTIPYYTAKTNTDVLLDEAASGNSWGTPHVVGTAVMLQQIDPTITPAQIMQIIQDSGVFVSDPDASVTLRLTPTAWFSNDYSRYTP